MAGRSIDRGLGTPDNNWTRSRLLLAVSLYHTKNHRRTYLIVRKLVDFVLPQHGQERVSFLVWDLLHHSHDTSDEGVDCTPVGEGLGESRSVGRSVSDVCDDEVVALKEAHAPLAGEEGDGGGCGRGGVLESWHGGAGVSRHC